tara:strand:+ start:8706 stop:9092 length:387 start_codon:yes stop_codon:yes gene_type:complete
MEKPEKKDLFEEALSKAKLTLVKPNGYAWGTYVWKKSNGKWFTDGNGNVLNIPSNKGDENQISKLKAAAAHHGEADGSPYFMPGTNRITDEEYSEQMDRMKQGLIPSMNDLGAVIAAKQTLSAYGDEG